MSLWLFGLDHLGLIQAPYNRRTKCLKRWSGREDLNLRPPGPEHKGVKIQVLHLVSLRSQQANLSLSQSYPVVPNSAKGFVTTLVGAVVRLRTDDPLSIAASFSRIQPANVWRT